MVMYLSLTFEIKLWSFLVVELFELVTFVELNICHCKFDEAWSLFWKRENALYLEELLNMAGSGLWNIVNWAINARENEGNNIFQFSTVRKMDSMSTSPCIVSPYFATAPSSPSALVDENETPRKKQRIEGLYCFPILFTQQMKFYQQFILGIPSLSLQLTKMNLELMKIMYTWLYHCIKIGTFWYSVHQLTRLGVACFNSSSQQMYITEAFEDFEFETVRQIKFQLKPNVIVTHSISLSQHENYQKALGYEGLLTFFL